MSSSEEQALLQDLLKILREEIRGDGQGSPNDDERLAAAKRIVKARVVAGRAEMEQIAKDLVLAGIRLRSLVTLEGEKPVVMIVDVAEKIACLKRELALRKNVYPKWVGQGRLKPHQAEREIEVMTAILRDYLGPE